MFQIVQETQGESVLLRVYSTPVRTGQRKMLVEMFLPIDEDIVPELTIGTRSLRTYLYPDRMCQILEP